VFWFKNGYNLIKTLTINTLFNVIFIFQYTRKIFSSPKLVNRLIGDRLISNRLIGDRLIS
jgi:hypothetical protein